MSSSTHTLAPEDDDEVHEQIMLKTGSLKADQGKTSARARQIDTVITGKLTRRLHALRRPAAAIPGVVCPECGGKMRLALLEPYPIPHTQKETTTFFCDCGEKYSYTIAPRTWRR